jgi:pimeloyl-ACP methyl ester carboxylesterase
LPAPWHALLTGELGALGYYFEPGPEQRRPLVLLHGVHAAASAYDMRPLFQRLRGSRPLIALDLPGFGSSSREPRHYTPELFVKAIERVLVDVVGTNLPADVAALSLSAEFAAKAAQRSRELFHRLVLISPTGLGSAGAKSPLGRALPRLVGTAKRAAARAVASGVTGRALFRLLATRPSIEYFLSRQFAGGVDPGFVAHALRTTKQPGAENAALAFVSGELFSRDAFETYAALRLPTLVIYDEDPHTGFERLRELLAKNPEVAAERVSPSRGLPHFDCPIRTARLIEHFLDADAPELAQAAE